jgi:hypothetical protein
MRDSGRNCSLIVHDRSGGPAEYPLFPALRKRLSADCSTYIGPLIADSESVKLKLLSISLRAHKNPTGKTRVSFLSSPPFERCEPLRIPARIDKH